MKGEAAPPQLRRHCGHLRRPRAPSRVTLVGKVDLSPRSCREEETRAEKAIRRSFGSADSSRDRRPRSGRSASVVVSLRLLKSSPAILRRMRRMILPERVFGRPDENWIMSGEAIGPIFLRTQVTSSWRNPRTATRHADSATVRIMPGQASAMHDRINDLRDHAEERPRRRAGLRLVCDAARQPAVALSSRSDCAKAPQRQLRLNRYDRGFARVQWPAGSIQQRLGSESVPSVAGNCSKLERLQSPVPAFAQAANLSQQTAGV
jgi:hypothetical protein